MAVENTTADAQYVLGRASAVISIDREGSMIQGVEKESETLPIASNTPTEEEKKTLRKVPGKLPKVAYYICAVEFAERASYYGVNGLFGNYVNRKLPVGGNGYGAPPRGTQTNAGALGMGSVISTAVSQSFSMLAYALPVFFGWMADAKTGRFKLICWGIAVCGVAHVIMVASGSKQLLESGQSKAPFFLSVYILSIGAAMFKPNISPTLLDQVKETTATTKILPSGEKVIVDPESTNERVMLWFYLLINIGAFMAVPTSYAEKYVGWWLAFLLPLILYMPLPILLWYLKDKLVLYPPGGSNLGNITRVVGICFKRGGLKRLFKKDQSFFDPAKPSVLAKSSHPIDVPWNEEFIDDVRRTFQATGIFAFFPIQNINDNGLGQAANTTTNMLTTNGVPNDVLNNFNALSIIFFSVFLNYGFYPLLRRWNIHYGPVARITTGLALAACAGAGYAIISWKGYQSSPCGNQATSLTCVDSDGNQLVSELTIWWMAIPYAIGGISELFVNVPAYGIAYSRAPPNMRSLVSALNLFNSAIAYAIGLAASAVVKDPYLTWDFAGPAIIGFIAAPVFYFFFRDIDKEDYRLSNNDTKNVNNIQNNNTMTITEAESDSMDEKTGVKVSEKKISTEK